MTAEMDDRDRQSILQDLQSPDEEVRRLAVERVASLPESESISHLVQCLGDASWRVRKATVERFVTLPDSDRAIGALIDSLADGENPGRRNAAVDALVRLGTRAVPRLLASAASEDPDVRKLVVDALAGIGDPETAENLVQMMRDSDANVRAASADALAAVGAESAPAALLRAATDLDEDPLVRFSAVHGLATLEVPVRAAELRSVLEDPVLLPAALGLLGRREDDEARTVLLKSLLSPARSARDAAIRGLLRTLARSDGAAADRLVADLREAAASEPGFAASTAVRLDSSELSTRLARVQFLGLLDDSDAVPALLAAGVDEAVSEVALAALETLGEVAERTIDAAWSSFDDSSRRVACEFLGRAHGDASGRRLLSALDDPDPELRTVAARAIGARGLPSGLPGLVRRLESSAVEDDFDGEQELSAVTRALVRLATPEEGNDPALTQQAIELLAGRLEGAAENVRLAIATVLGRIGRVEDANLVSFLLKDPSARVRRAAVDALARLESGSASEPLRLALADESSNVRIAAATALGAATGEEVVEDLRRLADDDDARVRAAAVSAIGSHWTRSGGQADPTRVTTLLQVALSDDAPVALSAVEALCEVGGPDAARLASIALERAEPEVIQAAIRCIAAHAGDTDPESLLPLVAHPDWSVRAEAIQTLADGRATRAVPAILRRLETEQDEFVREVILRALRRLEE